MLVKGIVTKKFSKPFHSKEAYWINSCVSLWKRFLDLRPNIRCFKKGNKLESNEFKS